MSELIQSTDSRVITSVARYDMDQWAYKSVLSRLAKNLGHKISNDNSSNDNAWLYNLNYSYSYNPTLTVLDSWAMVVDILGFYQDYITREAYLPHASEKRSLFELAKMVNIQLRLAQSADGWLTVVLENDPISQQQGVLFPKGTQVQSLPIQEEDLPQIFETEQDYHLYPQWNEIRVLPLSVLPPDNGQNAAADPDIAGNGNADGNAANNAADIDKNPAIPVTPEEQKAKQIPFSDQVVEPADQSLEQGEYILINQQYLAEIIKTDESNQNTVRIYWKPVVTTTGITDIQRFTGKARIFGYGAVTFDSLSFDDKKRIKLSSAGTINYGAIADKAFDTIKDRIKNDLILQIAAIKKLDDKADTTYLTTAKDNIDIVKNLQDTGYLSANNLTFKFSQQKKDLFAALKPEYRNYYVDILAILEQAYYADVLNAKQWSDLCTDFLLDTSTSQIYLDKLDEKISINTYITLIQPAEKEEQAIMQTYQVTAISEQTVAKYDLEDTVSCLQVKPLIGQNSAGKKFNPQKTQVHYQTEALVPVKDNSTKNAEYFAKNENPNPQTPVDQPYDKTALIVSSSEAEKLTENQKLVVTGTLADDETQTASEIVSIAKIEDLGQFKRITFEPKLDANYDPTTLTISANLIKVTHGESHETILGSGDNNLTFQSFTLPEDNISCFENKPSVEVRVNGIIWQAVENFQESLPSSQVYIIEKTPTEKWQITFGDGMNGSRLPTGEENITAIYRTGLGISGNIAADYLTSLLSPISYVKSITNPLAMKSGIDAGTLEELATDIPKKMRIMNRLLSEQDYIDYFSRKPEIALSAIKLLRNYQPAKLKIVLVMKKNLVPLEIESMKNKLLAELRESSSRDYYDLDISIIEPQYFTIEATIKLMRPVETNKEKQQARDELTKKNIQSYLQAEYSVTNSGFDQPIYKSQIIAAIHAMPTIKLNGATIDLCSVVIKDKGTNTAGDPIQAKLISEIQMRYPWVIEKIEDIHITLI